MQTWKTIAAIHVLAVALTGCADSVDMNVRAAESESLWIERVVIGKTSKADVLELAGKPAEERAWSSGNGKCVELWSFRGSATKQPTVFFNRDGVVCLVSSDEAD